jgi:uncharacterized membrane protein YgcG
MGVQLGGSEDEEDRKMRFERGRNKGEKIIDVDNHDVIG